MVALCMSRVTRIWNVDCMSWAFFLWDVFKGLMTDSSFCTGVKIRFCHTGLCQHPAVTAGDTITSWKAIERLNHPHLLINHWLRYGRKEKKRETRLTSSLKYTAGFHRELLKCCGDRIRWSVDSTCNCDFCILWWLSWFVLWAIIHSHTLFHTLAGRN